jgi:hypothetical protein
VSHTLKVIAGGLGLLGLLVLAARFIYGGAPAAGMAAAARWFIPLWLVAAGINMYIGVARAGYSVAEEAPIFLLVFAVPAAVALLLAWGLSRG